MYIIIQLAVLIDTLIFLLSRRIFWMIESINPCFFMCYKFIFQVPSFIGIEVSSLREGKEVLCTVAIRISALFLFEHAPNGCER
jgi:hypothetical protein